MTLEKISDKIYMLARLLRTAGDADISGAAPLCPVAVQTAADELLTLRDELDKHAHPEAALAGAA
jgi:hypothetical protein